MSGQKHLPEIEPESEPEEHYPVEPRYHPIHKVPRLIYDSLASAKLAMALLVVILACCVIGGTFFRGERAWILIFNTLWFNFLLVLLVVNVACCFFGRVWHRKLTIVSLGMILFHLSFVAMLCGIVYNRLFFFDGVIRLTEGETLPSNQYESYDSSNRGRFFNIATLKGETSLIKMQTKLMIGGEDKRAAYEIEVGEPGRKKRGRIYITRNLTHRGFTYFPEKEGYSPLVLLCERNGTELYGACVPLQSLRQKDNTFFYASGTKEGPSPFLFPHTPLEPRYEIQLVYKPNPLVERGGEVTFQVWPYDPKADKQRAVPLLAEGKAAIDEPFAIGNMSLKVKEIRYWAAMRVRYDPGKPIVLTSLWVAMAGMIMTTVGRMVRRSGVPKS